MTRAEDLDFIPPHTGKYIASAVTAVLAFGLGGCVAYEATPNEQPSAVDNGIDAYPTLTPDLSGFLAPSSDDHCAGGGKRPCAMLIRSEPVLESMYINAVPGQKRVQWPLEPFAGKKGDPVLIDCYNPEGETVYALDGSSSSSVWYRVIVQGKHVKNNELTGELLTGNITVLQYAGKSAMYAWAAAEWFGQTTADSTIHTCKE